MECHWIRNAECDLAALRDASDGVAVLPLASIESHGPHLPLGSDILCARDLVKRIVAEETVAVLPVLPYSWVAEARMRPGAVHVPSDHLIPQVEAICDEIHRNGFGKVVLLQCHGGNVALHQMMVKRMLERRKPYAVYSIGVFANIPVEMKDVLDSEQYGHACEMETSMNLVAAPELVHLERLGERTFPSQERPDVGDVLTPVDWTATHPQMAVGEPQKATPEKGERIMAAWAEGVVDTLRRIKRDEIVPAAMETYNRQVADPQGGPP